MEHDQKIVMEGKFKVVSKKNKKVCREKKEFLVKKYLVKKIEQCILNKRRNKNISEFNLTNDDSYIIDQKEKSVETESLITGERHDTFFMYIFGLFKRFF